MKLDKKLYLLWGVSLLPLLLVAIFYQRLPAQIPTNWGFNGHIEYGSRASLWGIAALSPFFAVLFPLLSKIDPRRKNYEKFSNYYYAFLIVLILFVTGMAGIIISESINPGTIAVYQIVTIAVCLLFTFIGNIAPKLKSNFFMGIKTPWTLSSTTVWYKTHRVAGRCWVCGGIAGAVSALFLREQVLFIVFFAILIVMCAIPVVYSYFAYQKEQKGGQTPEQ